MRSQNKGVSRNNKRLFAIMLAVCIAVLLFVLLIPANQMGARPLPQTTPAALSPIWSPSIQQWSTHIHILAKTHGLDPDFIAAVIKEESNGQANLVSPAGAVGLMGVMPSSPGLEWRPATDDLKNPAINLRWGVAILADVVRQSGGDLYSALAAYTGGWDQVESRVPRAYAAQVLDNYGRAIIVRNGQSPDIASQWTIAIEKRYGYVPNESLLVLGPSPLSGLHLYGKHIVYDYVDQSGKSYYIIGYAVPVALVAPLPPNSQPGLLTGGVVLTTMDYSDVPTKTGGNNPHVLMACLPGLDRLRGQTSTRWFAPSQCPDWGR
ncbi:MAG: lytic transglycosylase domain-containing protein [Chloroflexi bacterium]|nr:lytic transglycosylase domain-containing protein [Chloroflexota bacterium]